MLSVVKVGKKRYAREGIMLKNMNNIMNRADSGSESNKGDKKYEKIK